MRRSISSGQNLGPRRNRIKQRTLTQPLSGYENHSMVEVKVMEYKCLKCGTEFDVTYDATCPKCRASGFDVETLRKWKIAHPDAEDEA